MDTDKQDVNLGLVAARLKSARFAAQVSQKEVAKRTGCTQGYLSQLEGGAREPSMEMLSVLAKTLGVDVAWLIGGETDAALRESPRTPLQAILSDNDVPPGLRKLAEDENLIQALDVRDWEWLALRTMYLPVPPDKTGYILLLTAVRAAAVR